jgi:hypothetical protein
MFRGYWAVCPEKLKPLVGEELTHDSGLEMSNERGGPKPKKPMPLEV